MNLSVELLALGIPTLIFIVWAAWYNISLWIARRRYKPENDRARKLERVKGIEPKPSIRTAIRTVVEQPSICEPAAIVEPPKDSSSIGNISNTDAKPNPFKRKQKELKS